MSKLPLTLACARTDRMEALRQGLVQPESIALRVVEPDDATADIREMSLSRYFSDRAHGDPTLIAIPVFPLRRFAEETRDAARAAYESTGVFPIVTTLVMPASLHAQHPWVAESLFKACEQATHWAIEQMRFSGALRYMLPWLLDEIDEMDQLFGGHAWANGVEANRKALDMVSATMLAEKLIAKPLDIDVLFTPIVAWAE